MTKIKLLSETEKTVTLRRIDYKALLAAAENNADLSAIERHRSEEKRIGWDAAKMGYLTRAETDRLLDGGNPIRVWREKRGLTQRALADAAQMAVSYLAEIEGGKKPGSRDAVSRLSQILEVPMDQLVTYAEPSLQPVTRSEKAAVRLAELAEKGGNRARLADEAREIVRQWLEIATAEGLRHQVKAAIRILETLVLQTASSSSKIADETTDINERERMRRISDALESAWDALSAEYDKL